MDGATNYVIYSYADNTYTKLGYSTTNSFTASDLINGKKYGFIVRSYVSGKWSDWSNDDAVYATPKASANKPQNVKAVPGDKQVTITWNAVNGATNYIVYSYVDGSYHNLGTTTSTSFTAKNLVNGKKYGFIVKAWVNGGWNAWSNDDAVYATPVGGTDVRNVKAVPGNGQVALTWDKVSGATNYVIYSYADGKYTKQGYSDTTSFTVTCLLYTSPSPRDTR